MPVQSPRNAAAFRRCLLRWFRRHGRDLAWRRTRDPYHVIVSEFMLQQTQVSRVEAYYQRFLDRYPTIEALASAPAGMVRESWDGLGYYRRAANLHRLAQEVVRDLRRSHPGRSSRAPPTSGGRPLTAGAVASFAFERVAPAVDTNVARVLRRAFHPRTRARHSTSRVWSTARAHAPSAGKTAWAFNQAIMELGALVCTAGRRAVVYARCGRACATGRRNDVSSPASLPQAAPPARRSPKWMPRSAAAARSSSKYRARFAGGIESAEPGGSGKRDEEREQGGEDTGALHDASARY